MNDYNTLGIPYGSSKDEIKKAFRRLAHIHHPDKGGSSQKFSEISSAYSRLMKEDHQPINNTKRNGFDHVNDFWEKTNRWHDRWHADPFKDVFRKASQQQQQTRSAENIWQKYKNDELRRQVDNLLSQMTNVKRMNIRGQMWVNYTN